MARKLRIQQPVAICISMVLFVIGNSAGFADSIDVTSGTSGSLTPFPQSYNEIRAVDVTVLSDANLHINSMALRGLRIGPASSAFVGARLYNTTNGSLLASSSVTVYSTGTVTIPFEGTLVSGGNYRIGFYVETAPRNYGSGILFDPDPLGYGGFPYVEAAGLLMINNAYSLAEDSFPTNWNIYVPQLELKTSAGTQLQISLIYPNVMVQWLAFGSNALLETTSKLGDSTDWVTVTNSRAIVGSNVVVTIPLTGYSRFYRLR